MSGRNLQRYWNVLRTPVEVQHAVSDRRLRLVDAERVARLGDAVQAEIAQRIQLGENPKAVVADFLTAKSRYAGNPVILMLHGLARSLGHVEHRMEELTPHRLRNSVPQLSHYRKVLTDLIARATSGSEQTPDEAKT